MIRAHPRSAGLTRRLAERVRKLAEAHAANRLLARRAEPRRWRDARLLWPLFAKDDR